MNAHIYDGPRLCSCGQRAEVILDTGRPDASHTTLLCWRCADDLIVLLVKRFKESQEAKKEVSYE